MKDKPTFMGYSSEGDMIKKNPTRCHEILLASTSETVTVCSKDKVCVGSIDGKTFKYEDGTTDLGREVSMIRSELDGVIHKWFK